MSRTVQVDDDVYTWLQSIAIPFEEDLSGVLRRVKRAYEGYVRLIGVPKATAAVQSSSETAQMVPIAAPAPALAAKVRAGIRPKLDSRILQTLGVSHFVVDGNIPEYRATRARVGQRAHERAYLDAMIDSGRLPGPYFQRWKEQGLPNPRGDSASRVILKVGARDNSSLVRFVSGKEMRMSEFIASFLNGNL